MSEIIDGYNPAEPSTNESFRFEGDIIARLLRLKTKFESQLVYITPNTSYLMNNIINRARKNYSGQFDNPYFPSGQEKVWYPLTENLIKVVRKLLKLSVSDFNFIPLQAETFGAVRLLHYATLAELRRARFSNVLQRVKETVTIDGSVILKRSDFYSEEYKRRILDIQIKDWFNVLFDHTANSLNESPVIERFIIPMEEALQMKDWKNVEGTGTIDPRYLDPQATLASPTYLKSGDPVFVGNYCWLRMPKAWIKAWNKQEITKADLTNYVEGVIVVSRLGDVQKDDKGNSHDLAQIHYVAESPFKNRFGKPIKPYVLIRYEHLPGRLPGRGPVEALFDLQLYLNAVINIRMVGNMIRNTVLLFFNPQRTGLRPGDMERLSPTGMIPMNQLTDDAVRFPQIPPAPDTYNEQKEIMDSAQRATGATDTAQAQSPASKSATGNVLDSQYTQSSFQDIRESIAEDFIPLFDDLIIPFVIDNLDEEEILMVTGDTQDLDDFDEKVIEHHVATEALKFIKRTGRIPTSEETEAEKEKLRTKFRNMGSRPIKLEKEFKDSLKKLEYHLQVNIANEVLPIETIIGELKNLIGMVPPENMADINLDANKVFALIFDRLGYRYEALQKPRTPQNQMMQLNAMMNQSGPMNPNPTNLTTGNSVAPAVNALNKTGVKPIARSMR